MRREIWVARGHPVWKADRREFKIMRLQDKVAIVTGCARDRGIGRAIAMRLAREGAHIVAADYCRSIAEYPDAKFGQMEEL